MDRNGLQAEYERALARAAKAGLSVVADGYTADGQRVYFIPSSKNEAIWYHVVLTDAGFKCSCAQGTDGQGAHYCTHRALARQAHVQEDVQQEQAAPKATRAQSAGYTVTYDGRKGKGSKCAACGEQFAIGERITLSDGQAFHTTCVTQDQTGHPGDTAYPRRSNRAFSLMK